jgi:arylsulfatase A-like enzyme
MSGKWHVGQNHGVVPRGNAASSAQLNAPAGGFYYPDSPRTELFLNGETSAGAAASCRRTGTRPTSGPTSASSSSTRRSRRRSRSSCYLATTPRISRLQAPADEIAKFRGKYKIGWDKLREQRHARQIELGIVDKAWPLSPRPDRRCQRGTASRRRSRTASTTSWRSTPRCVAHMDTAVGRLVAALKQRGVLDNTLILFLSRQRRQRRERPERPAGRRFPRRAQSTSSRPVVGDALETRRSAATSISTTKAASPRR